MSARQILRKSGSAPASETVCVVLIGDHDRLYGIAVDRYVGERTLVVLPLDARLGKVHAIRAHAQTGTVRPQWYIRPPLVFA